MSTTDNSFYKSCITCLYLKIRNNNHYTIDYETAVDHIEETERMITDYNNGETHGYTEKAEILWDYLGLSKDYLIFFE